MLKRTIILVFITCLGTFAALSRQSVPDRHIVQKGDTWYALSKKYHVTYADLRLENQERPDQLNVGDTLRIPKPADVKHDEARKETNEIAAPVNAPKKHKVKSGETLTSIAKKYKCSVADLKAWNKLSNQNLKLGQVLIVGKPKPVTAQAPAPRTDSVMTIKTVAAVHKPAKDTLVITVAKNDSASPTVEKPAEQRIDAPTEATFAKGRKEMTEEGAVVWIEDEEINPGKYFALHRIAPIGTIVKVTNRMNRRVVFVKVVGKLPDTGENEGIILKISKAAAEKLGVIDARFQAQLNYGVEAP